MRNFKIEEIEKALGGKIIGKGDDSPVNKVSIDSRKVDKDTLFFPIIGENHDGHSFIEDVIESGCKNIVISDEKAIEEIESKKNINIVSVKDTAKALGDLAKYYLGTMKIDIIGVTGSTGKTSTKDMLYHVFNGKYKTRKTEGNFNNHLGLPLTVLDFPEDTEIGILEMGMDKLGEIEYLVEIANPKIGIITNIGLSHMESLGSQEGILKAKMEITKKFDENNSLIVSYDEKYLNEKTAKGNYKLVLTGKGENNEIEVKDVIDKGIDGIEFILVEGDESYNFLLPTPGKHNALNAALAVAAGREFGITLEEAAIGLRQLSLTNSRGSIKRLKDMYIIDDTYNASPDSMRAGIDLLMSLDGNNKIAILGDMFELGEETEKFHMEVGQYAKDKGVNKVIGVGSLGRLIAVGAKDKGESYENKDDLIYNIGEEILGADAILVKGSRGMAMEEIVKRILEIGENI